MDVVSAQEDKARYIRWSIAWIGSRDYIRRKSIRLAEPIYLKLETGNWKQEMEFEIGNWKVESGNWNAPIGHRRYRMVTMLICVPVPYTCVHVCVRVLTPILNDIQRLARLIQASALLDQKTRTG